MVMKKQHQHQHRFVMLVSFSKWRVRGESARGRQSERRSSACVSDVQAKRDDEARRGQVMRINGQKESEGG